MNFQDNDQRLINIFLIERMIKYCIDTLVKTDYIPCYTLIVGQLLRLIKDIGGVPVINSTEVTVVVCADSMLHTSSKHYKNT